MPVHVRCGPGGVPTSVTMRGRRLAVTGIRDCWLVQTEWWRERPISRTYFDLLLADGRRLTVFHDDQTDTWHQQRW